MTLNGGVLFDTLLLCWLVKEFPQFSETRKFIAVFTAGACLSL
jgi:hypothetical protein